MVAVGPILDQLVEGDEAEGRVEHERALRKLLAEYLLELDEEGVLFVRNEVDHPRQRTEVKKELGVHVMFGAHPTFLLHQK